MGIVKMRVALLMRGLSISIMDFILV